MSQAPRTELPLIQPASETGAEEGHGLWRSRLYALIAIPCILGLTLWQSYSSYNDTIDNSKDLAAALSRVAEEHFTGILRTVDHVLNEAVEMAPEDGPLDIKGFRELMRLRMSQYRYIRNAFVVGANGITLGGTMDSFTGIGVGDREYFTALAADPGLSLYISVPLKSRAQAVTSVFVSRAVRDASGAFRGLVVIAIDPALFEEELKTVQPAQGGFATLLRSDGVILARVPDGDKLVGTMVANGPAMTSAALAQHGVLHGRGAVDGAERILAYRRLGGYPLVVVVGMRLESILQSWRTEAVIHGLVGFGLCLLLGAMAWLSDNANAARLAVRKALLQSEQRYRLLTERSPFAIVHADSEGRVLYANDHWLTLTGRSPEQILGRKWCAVLDDEDRQAAQSAWQGVVGRGGVYSGDMRLKSASGALRWLRCHISVLDPDMGVAGGCLATFEDISTARLAEQGLRLSEEKFAKAFLGSPDALVISTQGSGRYVEVNDAFCRLLGYPRSELMGTDAITLGVWPFPEERQRLVRAVEQDGQAEGCEAHLRRKDGSVILAMISAQPIVVGGYPCLLFICRDVSEQRAMEARTRELLAALDASNQELEQFAYVASHDLQEPLRMIAGFAQLLERRYKGKLDAEADEFITFLVDGARRMQVMIRDLLEYSRVERMGEAFTPFATVEAMEEVRRNLLAAIEETGAQLRFGDLPDVTADRSQFVRLMQNLVGNALKYRHPERPPVITVSAERQAEQVAFSVSDNGIGIDPQYFERIFLVFQRLHTRDKFEGTGIGLAVCKKIVERHGGRMWVESTPGVGSSFHFTMSIAPAPKPQTL